MTGNKENKTQSVELRSNNVQEILGYVPVWIVRWGITLITIIVLGVLTGSWFYQYPDIVRAPVMVTTENPPSPVMAKANGRIIALFVSDTQNVEQGQTLAVIEILQISNRSFSLKKNWILIVIRFLIFLSRGLLNSNQTPTLE